MCPGSMVTMVTSERILYAVHFDMKQSILYDNKFKLFIPADYIFSRVTRLAYATDLALNAACSN